MKVLDLFCGKKGWSRPFIERGHTVITSDYDPTFEPDVCRNIFEMDAETFEWYIMKERFDVVLASPPCECFSVASIGTHWAGGIRQYRPKTGRAAMAKALVEWTLSIIEDLDPTLGWIVENPRGVLRKMPFMQTIERHTVTYCQYGEKRMKPTDLWGHFPKSLVLNPMCKNGDPCHERAPRGAKTGTQGIKGYADRSEIPYRLALAVCLAFENSVDPNLVTYMGRKILELEEEKL